MAEETRFFERQVDRTAYHACWGVALVVVAVWFILAWGLWQAGTWLRHHPLPTFHKPSLPTLHTPNPANIIQSAQSSAQQSVNSTAQQAEQQAEQKAADTAKKQATDQLNQFLQK